MQTKYSHYTDKELIKIAGYELHKDDSLIQELASRLDALMFVSDLKPLTKATPQQLELFNK